MPIATKQVIKPGVYGGNGKIVQIGKKPGGILARAVAIEDTPDVPLKILLYGANRTGKTTLACQFPKPLLLVSFEPAMSGGKESVKRVPGVRCFHVIPDESPRWKNRENNDALLKMDECVELLHQLCNGGSGLATVVCDGATSLQDVILTNLLGAESMPEQLNFKMVTGDQYRDRAEQTKQALRKFLDLPMDTVILAKEKDHNPPKEERINEKTGKVQPDMRAKFLRGLQQESFIAAELGGATVGWLQDACDICRLYVEMETEEFTVKVGKEIHKKQRETGRYVRYLRTGYHPNYAAGIRSSTPDNVPDVIVKPTYEKLLKAIRG